MGMGERKFTSSNAPQDIAARGVLSLATPAGINTLLTYPELAGKLGVTSIMDPSPAW